MYEDRKKHTGRTIAILIGAAVFIALLFVFVPKAVSPGLWEEEALSIRTMIEENAHQCYVVEGNYPESLEYLADHYGIQVNTRDFYIVYEAFASNLPPTVRVIPKR